MSDWEQAVVGMYFCFCPQCKRKLGFDKPLAPPELLKCIGCGAQWCLISFGDGKAKDESDGKNSVGEHG